MSRRDAAPHLEGWLPAAPRPTALGPAAIPRATLLGILAALFVRTFLLQVLYVPTRSMEPTLLAGDSLLVNRFIFAGGRIPGATRPVRRGDLVVFRLPEDPWQRAVKRCVGVAGDLIELRAKRLFLNGREVPDLSYAPRALAAAEAARPPRDTFGPYRVPAGHFFVLGDNRDDSRDSRFWGPLPVTALVGRPLAVPWSVAPPPARRLRAERTLRLVR